MTSHIEAIKYNDRNRASEEWEGRSMDMTRKKEGSNVRHVLLSWMSFHILKSHIQIITTTHMFGLLLELYNHKNYGLWTQNPNYVDVDNDINLTFCTFSDMSNKFQVQP